MQCGIGDRKYICRNSDKMKETSAQILTPYERSMHLVFWYEEWRWGRTPSTWNFGQNWPISIKNADFHSIFAPSASAILGERSSIITNSKSTTHFQMRLWWTAYFVSKTPKGTQKRSDCFCV